MTGTSLAEWLRRQLRRRDWSQSDLARELAVGTGTVSRWMNGRQPDTRYCERIAEVFDADIDTVLTLAGHRPTTDAIEPDESIERLISKLRRLRHLEAWKVETVEVMLDVWLRQQREQRLRAAESAPPAYDAALKR